MLKGNLLHSPYKNSFLKCRAYVSCLQVFHQKHYYRNVVSCGKICYRKEHTSLKIPTSQRKSSFCISRTNFMSGSPSFDVRQRNNVIRAFSSYRAKPIFLQAEKHLENTAIIDEDGCLKYEDILHHSMNLAVEILDIHQHEINTMKLNEDRIAILTDQNATYVVGQFATWMCNGISVPLCVSHPAIEWEYFLSDAQCSLLLVSENFLDKIKPVADKLKIAIKIIGRDRFNLDYQKNRWFQPDHATNPSKVRRMYEQRKQRWFDRPDSFIMEKPALIVYTSGTTGRPKGVVLTHGNLSVMASGMISRWGWTQSDVILHVLPLHHVHGIVNVLLTPLACGATCVMLPKFDAERVWHLLASPQVPHSDKSINIFMAVPTIYAKLIEYYDKHLQRPETNLTTEFLKATLSTKIRLMVSGSAALPQPIMDRWHQISGHTLLERYGMTEIGMALSNPLNGPRIPGAVGIPMPGVEVRIVSPNVYNAQGFDILAQGDERQTQVTEGCDETPGDLHVKGPTVFKTYWNKPEATADAFTKDRWFKTGDTAVFKNSVYRIVGRTSVDVIKSGGFKISALDVERHLLAHPDIEDCAVVGLPDMTWGQRVAAVVVCKGGENLELQTLKKWSEDQMPHYQVPTVLKCLETIPRNAMGKVNKKELVDQVFPEVARASWR